MRIDPVGTSGAPCEIKKKAILWNDVIQHTKINGYPILVKESKLLCSNCPSAKITFKDNGQDKEIRYAESTFNENRSSRNFRSTM